MAAPQDDTPPLTDALSAMFQRGIHATYAHKDVPRLVKRLTVADSSGVLHDPAAVGADVPVIERVVEVGNLLTRRLAPERAAAVAEALAEVRAGVGEGSDMQMVMTQVFDAMGADSPAVAVFKVIHQGVVLEGAFRLRQRLAAMPQSKDIRTAEGWRVRVSLPDDGFLQVAHLRREQSLDAFGDLSDHFEFEWEVRMTFAADMSALTAASLRVTALHFGDEVPAARQDELRQMLAGGDLILE